MPSGVVVSVGGDGNADNPTSIVRELEVQDVVPIEDRDVGELVDHPPGVPFDEAATRRQQPAPRCEPLHPPAAVEPQHVGRHADGDRSGGDETVAVAGQQSFERRFAATEQHMEVFGLRHARSQRRMVDERVALDDRDVVEVSAERRRRGEPGHARAEDNGVAVLMS